MTTRRKTISDDRTCENRASRPASWVAALSPRGSHRFPSACARLQPRRTRDGPHKRRRKTAPHPLHPIPATSFPSLQERSLVDVELSDLAMREEEVLSKINDNTKAILLTHVLGYDGMKDRIQSICREKGIILVEDVCESHGATHNGKKCGTFGTISNFSFYYAHHMSTIEGGMICTDDREIYRMLRMFRSHGMLRECDDPDYMDTMSKKYEDIYPEFIFMVPGYNMRSTELNAVIGLNQLKRLDENVKRRRENYDLFLSGLNKEKYYTDFKHDGNSNYAFVILLRKKYKYLYEHVVGMLKEENVEFRRGTAGGGNLTRQPFLKMVLAGIDPADFVNVDYIHHYGLYTGNYPDLPKEKIMTLTQLLNDVE